MSCTNRSHFYLALLPCLLAATAGCSVDQGPALFGTAGVFPLIIPVSPHLQKRQEDKFWNQERYERVPILGPVTGSGPPRALDPPSPDEVMRAVEEARPVQGGLAMLHEVQRNNVRMVIEPISEYIDPPRVYPLIGPAQLHHAHYKCTIYFAEVTRVGWPVPYTTVDEDTVEVVYIDHNHLHMVGDVGDGQSGNY